MAGHSQFKNIMHRKGAQDARRARQFTRLIREISVAAREGQPDPESNPRLRSAIAAARGANMPRDNIERAIRRSAGGPGGPSYEPVRYEGYGPGGAALIVETLTDNRNRTTSAVRTAFTKHGGNLGEANSVSFLFDRVGSIRFAAAAAIAEDMLEAAVEAGAHECDSNADGHEVTCPPDDLHRVARSLEERFGAPESAQLAWVPLSTVAVDDDRAAPLFKLMETLEEDDDVQAVSSNFEVSDDVLTRLSA